MANPNIVNVTDIRGKTSVLAVTTTITAIVSNSAASNEIFKINSLVISNIHAADAADVTVDIFRAAASFKVANTITIPANASLIVISKDTGIYLEEGDSLRVQASANTTLQAVCSYEIIK